MELDLQELEERSAGELIVMMRDENLSIIKSLGAGKIRRKTFLVDILCGIFLRRVAKHSIRATRCARRAIYGSAYRECHTRYHARGYVLKKLIRYAPVRVDGVFPRPTFDKCHVIGFNHPSLGEVIRIIGVCFEAGAEQEIFLPVSLAWFEIFAKYIPHLNALGIHIAPLITPSLEKDIYTATKNNPNAAVAMNTLRAKFLEFYFKCCRMEAQNHSYIIVAPSATRQETVFSSKSAAIGQTNVSPVIATLALNLAREKNTDVDYTPIAVIPPEGYKKGLNLFKEYQLCICDSFSGEYIAKLRAERKTRELDYSFLIRIAEKVPQEMICPDNG